MGKPRLLGRGFSLLYDLIVADWVELVCNLTCFIFMELDGSGLDTLFCWLFWGMFFCFLLFGPLRGTEERQFSRSGSASTPAFGKAETPYGVFSARLNRHV